MSDGPSDAHEEMEAGGWSFAGPVRLSYYAAMAGNAIVEATGEYNRPSAVWRPKLTIDGDQWCALYGNDLEEGVAGFGDSPEAAMRAFDVAWYTKLIPSGIAEKGKEA